MRISILILFCFLSITLKAQIEYKESDYKSTPVWIKMMDDENVNFNQAVLAYETYWKDKIKPEGEDDVINENASRKEERDRERFQKQLKKMKPAERNEYDQLKYQCKRFEDWRHQSLLYVQENGHILNQQERIELWNKQQAEIKLQNKTNK